MKVILLDELKGRGGEGDVVEVATGYAVNFLFPRKIAIAATKGNLKQLEQRKHNIAKRETTRLDTADKLMATLEGQKVRIGAKVGEEGQLFGSVTPAQVAEAINATFGAEVDRRRVDLHGIVKTAGEHTATVSIYRELKANIVVEVVDERVLAAEAASAAAVEVVAEAASAAVVEVVAEVVAEDVAAVEDAIEAVAEDAIEAAVEAVEAVEAFEDIDARLEDVAEVLVAAAEAAESEDADVEAAAEAAVEVLRDVEEVVDTAVVEAIVDVATDEVVDEAADDTANEIPDEAADEAVAE